MTLTIAGNNAVVTNPTHDSNAATPGQGNLSLEQFSNEVQGAFLRETTARALIRTKTISNGLSYQFPFIGGVTSDYHQPGEEIQGQAVAHAAKTIVANDTIFTAVNISDFEQMIIHFDSRGEYTRRMGDELAQKYDQQVYAMLVKAALAEEAGAIPGEFGAANAETLGAGITSAASAGFATTLLDAAYAAQQRFDETNIPKSERCMVTTPAVYYALVADGTHLNRDFGNQNGSQSDASIMKIAGLPIVVTNNMALNHNLAVERRGAVVTDFDVDATGVAALFMHKQAAAVVELMGVKTESSYRHEFFADLVTSRMAYGMGVLRPECLNVLSFGA